MSVHRTVYKAQAGIVVAPNSAPTTEMMCSCPVAATLQGAQGQKKWSSLAPEYPLQVTSRVNCQQPKKGSTEKVPENGHVPKQSTQRIGTGKGKKSQPVANHLVSMADKRTTATEKCF